ncbi:hypothetical protein CRUP_012932 [Coryphaenoides rupestris]|nr:hypothetical protein CRUP_012932 [Coryphaenoides rupestris]
MAKQYDVLFRLLLLGDSGVGKTCLLCRFTDNEFHPSHISTIGVDFKMKTLMIDGVKGHCGSGAGIFLVYDITSERSFQHIMKWASDVDELAEAYGMDFFETSAYNNHNITECFTRLAEQVLAANKKDLDHLRMSMTDELDLTALEDEEGIGCGSAADGAKGCWC